MASFSEPRFTVGIDTDNNTDSGKSRSFPYVNIALEDGDSGYSADQVKALAQSLSSALNEYYVQVRLNAQYVV